MKGEAFAPVPNRGMITISIMMANIMQGVDNTILNVALPHVQGSLSGSLDQIAWALTSYIVCAAIMMPLSGWLAGRRGMARQRQAAYLGQRIAVEAQDVDVAVDEVADIEKTPIGAKCDAFGEVAHQSAGAPRASHGGVRHRDDPRANHGAGAGRLVDL